MIPARVCFMCDRYIGKDKCEAFEDGIPKRILDGKNDHSKKVKGDGGLLFKSMNKEKEE